MTYQYKLLAVLLPLMLLAGCQTMTAGECQTADWFKIGQQDGNAGKDDMMGKRLDSCNTNKVPVADSATSNYRRGYNDGLRYYCLPKRIQDDAVNGRNQLQVCPLAIQPSLRPALLVGTRVYEDRQHVDQLSSEQDALNSELKDPKTGDSRARDIRRRLHHLRGELEDASYELRYSRSLLQP
jgi:outer membrane murein-binding lipoprotein Lpp